MPASRHRPGYDPKAKRPTSQPVTAKADVTKGGFSKAVATYHDRLAQPLEDWTPDRPEKTARRHPSGLFWNTSPQQTGF